MSLYWGAGWGVGGWDTALQNLSKLQNGLIGLTMVVNITKLIPDISINLDGGFRPVSYVLVSSYQSHLQSTRVHVDTRQATETS